VFEFETIEGAIVGFRCPAFVKGINVPGYHFHFIDEDRSVGGHLLECNIRNAQVGIDYTSEFFMELSEDTGFFEMDLAKDKEKELEQVER